jgi:hypothetical protein
MTLQQTIDTIDPQYPLAGQDNDSQGFRDNFSNIKDALNTVNTELNALQTNAIVKADLATGTETVENDLAGSSIVNGYYNNLYGTSYVLPVSTTTDIDVSQGSVQQFTLSANITFTFKNWPKDGSFGVIRAHFLSNGSGTFTPTLYANAGSIVKEANFPGSFTVSASGKHKVIEAWSYNNGATVYVRYLGEF